MSGPTANARTRSSLSRNTIRCVWTLLLTVATANASLLLTFAYLYGIVPGPTDFPDNRFPEFLIYLSNGWRNDESDAFVVSNWKWVTVAYLVLALPFVQVAVTMIWSSIRMRQLSFGTNDASSSVKSSHRAWQLRLRAVCSRRFRRFRRSRVMMSMHSVWGRVSTVYKSVDVGGINFEDQFIVIEVIETILQTIQAHQVSETLSVRFIGVWYGGIIFLNCWSAVFVHTIERCVGMPRHLGHILHLVIDQLLGCMWATVPLSYYVWQSYQWYVFPYTMHFSHSVDELSAIGHQLAIPSWRAFALSNFALAISAAVQRNITAFLSFNQDRVSFPIFQVVPHSLHPVHRTLSTKSRYAKTFAQRAWRHLQLFITILRPIHGVVVFLLTVLAGSSESPGDNFCVTPIFPWFTTKPACLGLQFVCLPWNGSAPEETVNQVFNGFSLDRVRTLEFAWCSHFEVPVLPRLPQLTKLSFTYCTIEKWDTDAALRLSALPALQYVDFSSGSFAVEPDGFLLFPLPATVTGLSMSYINATEVVPLVNGELWQHVAAFNCDSCGIVEIPECVRSMYQLRSLSLAGDSIQQIPDNVIDPYTPLEVLALSGNPLSDLPLDVWARLCQPKFNLAIDGTNISTIPEEIKECISADAVIVGFGIPLCQSPPDWIGTQLQCWPPEAMDNNATVAESASGSGSLTKGRGEI